MDKLWRNDFGEWACNLPGTVCYIHTTPDDEFAWHFQSKNIQLENSHGCIHLHPKDREDMMRKGYLKQGAYFEVKGYSEKGPP
jgi:lipoprotein-anchoring transpeptidase ErfK/SrfK